MSREMRNYERKLLKEMEEASFWKKLWKAIELSSIYNKMGE